MTLSIQAIRYTWTCAVYGALIGLWPFPAGAMDDETANDTRIVYRVLHRFTGTDGISPSGELVQSADGKLYGVTNRGGAFDGGTFYRLAPDGSVTVLHDFGSPGDGYGPRGAPLETAEGVFYGTTSFGGAFGGGTVYKLAVGRAYSVVHSFEGEGEGPAAGLIEGRDGNLYGTTLSEGGIEGGTVFGLSPDGEFWVLHVFDPFDNVDGAGPAAALLQASDGNLYGTTCCGYGITTEGIVFRLTLSGDYTIVHVFTAGYAEPRAPLIQAVDGNLYGTTPFGGQDCGTVYRMTLDGVFATVHIFLSGVEGCGPSSGLLEAGDGYLYGTTSFGGDWQACDRQFGCGTVYRMTLDGAVTVVHDFDERKGDTPGAGLTRTANRRLVGSTTDAFTGRAGTVFGLGESPRP
jgi:uncharacterized repeat protein (TIGR03803 family)